jgi:hypothetical protein
MAPELSLGDATYFLLPVLAFLITLTSCYFASWMTYRKERYGNRDLRVVDKGRYNKSDRWAQLLLQSVHFKKKPELQQ